MGLHTRGAGADNIRNLTANPTAGIDPYELIDVSPFCHELGQFIINNREFYDLPRKFNVAFDGGGLIGTVQDTNDIGVRAVRTLRDHEDLKAGVYFRIALGGATSQPDRVDFLSERTQRFGDGTQFVSRFRKRLLCTRLRQVDRVQGNTTYCYRSPIGDTHRSRLRLTRMSDRAPPLASAKTT